MNKAVMSIVCLGLLLFLPALAAAAPLPGGPSTVVTAATHVALPDGYTGFIVYPNNPTPNTPWVWYAPTLFYPASQGNAIPDSSPDWLFNQLLSRGIAIAGVDAGEFLGDPAGCVVYNDFYTYAMQQGLAPKALMIGQSRGGLMALSWAEKNPQKVSGIAGIYPACDLASWPGLSDSGLQQAYGMTQAQLQANLTSIDPIDNLAPLAQAKIPIFFIFGASDTTVPPAQNEYALQTNYQALGGACTCEAIPGLGHQEDSLFFQSTDLLNFVVANVDPLPAPEPGSLALLAVGLLAAALAGRLCYAWRKRRS